ncbi:ketoacyl-synthetase C-terminal extension domain-containing protein [Streptomyces zhihengii]
MPWDRLSVTVPRRNRPWPAGPRVAGVNSFGMSGTNAHVVLQGYDAPDPDPTPPPAARGRSC